MSVHGCAAHPRWSTWYHRAHCAAAAADHWKASGLDLAPILQAPEAPEGAVRHCVTTQDHGLDRALDHAFLDACRPAIEDDAIAQHLAEDGGSLIDDRREWDGENDAAVAVNAGVVDEPR